MSEGLNRAALLGNLGADPELRATQSGTSVLRLRVATTSSYVDRDKERHERTDWHDVVLFGKRAEALGRVLRKGERVYVEGELRTSSYEKDGEKRYRTEVHAQHVVLCGGGLAKAGERPKGPRPLPKPGDGPRAPLDYDEVFGPGNDDSDLPF
jgi:single-strand DNA-binding protein